MAWYPSDIEKDNEFYSITNSSDISVPGSTWTKICTISTVNLKGKYFIQSGVSDAVNSKLYYCRICRNGNVDLTIVNIPYGTGNLYFLADITEYDSIDFYLYGEAQTIAKYHAVLRLYKF